MNMLLNKHIHNLNSHYLQFFVKEKKLSPTMPCFGIFGLEFIFEISIFKFVKVQSHVK